MSKTQNMEWFDAPRLADMPMAEVMEEFQAYEDGLTFGSAFLKRVDGKMRTVHPGECLDGAENWWRVELFMRTDDPDRIFARIVDNDTIHAEIVGALFLDKRPCCGNLATARQIVAAGPAFEKITGEG